MLTAGGEGRLDSVESAARKPPMADGAVRCVIGRGTCPYRMFGRLVTDRFLGARVVVRKSMEQLRRKWRDRQQHDGRRHEGEAEAPKDTVPIKSRLLRLPSLCNYETPCARRDAPRLDPIETLRDE